MDSVYKIFFTGIGMDVIKFCVLYFVIRLAIKAEIKAINKN